MQGQRSAVTRLSESVSWRRLGADPMLNEQLRRTCSEELTFRRALEVGYKERQVRIEVTAAATVREINRLAHFDTRKFYDEHGNLRPIHSLPDDLAACIASIEVVKRNMASGDDTTERIYKIRLWSKPQAFASRNLSRPE